MSVEGEVVASISRGLLVLAGVESGDTESDVVAAARKVVGLRIFADDRGKMNLDVGDVGGSILVVSQFTLAADVRRGRRPSFAAAAEPAIAVPLLERFATECREGGVQTSTGRFGALMEVALVNDGPVTIVVEARDGRVR